MDAIIEDVFCWQSRLCQKRAFRIFAFSGGSLMAVWGFIICLLRILISEEIGDGGVGNAIVAPMFIAGFILFFLGSGAIFITILFKKHSYKIACIMVKDFLCDYPRPEYIKQFQSLLSEMAGAGSRDKDPARIYHKLKELRSIEKKRRRVS